MVAEMYRVGQRFNCWTLLRKMQTVNRNRRWLCACDCGDQLVVYAGNVISGKSRQCHSCGVRKRVG